VRGLDYERVLTISLSEAFSGIKRIIRWLEIDGHEREIEASIPPGVRDGVIVKIVGAGGEGTNGGPQGDLYLVIRVSPEPGLEQKGDDLYTRVEVEVSTAALGGEVEVQSVERRLNVTIPPETQNNQVFRLAGQGMPRLSKPAERGDLYVRVELAAPVGLSEEERDLFQRLRDLRTERKKAA
jgi:curved DNA-binding protein